MRLQMTEKRERRIEQLKNATGENTKSKAIDQASEFYIRMAGDTVAIPTGAFTELMQAAESNGSLTPEEIATILDTDQLPVNAAVVDTDQLPVNAAVEWSIGKDA